MIDRIAAARAAEFEERPQFELPFDQGKPYVVCSCGNLIELGDGPLTAENAVTREHPACGRKPVRLRGQDNA